MYDLSRDLVTFRTHSAKRKSAVEVLKATKSLYIKSPKCQDDSRLPQKREYARKGKKKDPDQLQSKLRKLLDDSSSKENIADWGCFEDLNFKFYSDCDVQYQSLPDLSISSKESNSCTIHPISNESDKMTISSSSSSSKSYGKPPSHASSLLSACGSAGKVEEKLSGWTQPKHARELARSRSLTCDKRAEPEMEAVSKDLNDFFEHLGLSSEEYRALTSLTEGDSRTSSPVFFSSRSSQGSGRSSRVQDVTDLQDNAPSDPLSVVQTNARVVKWLCRLQT